MSNDRHLEIQDGTMGNLFRRVTLATLGLDSMEGVSEQSFDVIDRADSFVARLMDGVSHVMPKRKVDIADGKASGFSDHILDGISGLEGPKNATDLQDWQYWLDAALLMLFDEDDEEEEGTQGGTAKKSARKAKMGVQANSEAVRRRVAELQKSGVKPAMLQALPAAQKRSLFETIQKVSEGKMDASSLFATADRVFARTNAQESAQPTAGTRAEEFVTVASQTGKSSATIGGLASAAAGVIRSFLQSAYSAPQTQTQVRNAENILAANGRGTRQLLASRVASVAEGISRQVAAAEGRTPAMQQAHETWMQALQNMGSQAHFAPDSLRTMLQSLDSLVEMGAVDETQAASLREASRTYARRTKQEESAQNGASATIGASLDERFMRATMREMAMFGQNGTNRAFTHADDTADAVFRRSFSMIEQHLGDLNKAVSRRIASEGESASTMRWARASERFERLQGISDDMDRVLLRDVVESAHELETAGIVPRRSVSEIVRIAGLAESDATATGSHALLSTSKSGDGAKAWGFAQFGSSRVLGKLADHIGDSVTGLVSSLAGAGVKPAGVESFVSDIQQLLQTSSAVDPKMATRQAASVIESICDRLDAFAETAATAAVEEGYAELGESRGAFVNTAEAPEPVESGSARVMAARLASAQDALSASQRSVAQMQTALVEAQTSARAEAAKQMRQNVEALRLEDAERRMVQAVSEASSLEELVAAQNAIAPHLSDERRAELAKVIEAVRHGEQKLARVEKQVRAIADTAKLAQSLREAAAASQSPAEVAARSLVAEQRPSTNANAASQSVVLDGMRIDGRYLSALNGTLASFARIRNGFAMPTQGTDAGVAVAGLTDSRMERMLSIVKPMQDNRGTLSVAEREMIANARAQISVGYREIVPESVYVASAAQYPSQQGVQDLSGILGARKAAAIHAADVANGRTSSVGALAAVMQKLASQKFAFAGTMDSEQGLEGFAARIARTGETGRDFDSYTSGDYGSAADERRFLAAEKSQEAADTVREVVAKHGGNAALRSMLSASDASRVEQILASKAPSASELSELQKIFAQKSESVQADTRTVAQMLAQETADGANHAETVASLQALVSRHAFAQHDADVIQQILAKSSIQAEDVHAIESILRNSSDAALASDVMRSMDSAAVQEILASASATHAPNAAAMAQKAFENVESFAARIARNGESGRDYDSYTSRDYASEAERKLIVERKSQQAADTLREVIAKHGGNAALRDMLSASDAARVEQILSGATPAAAEFSELQKIFAQKSETSKADSQAIAEMLQKGVGQALSAETVTSVNALVSRHVLSQHDADVVKQILAKPQVAAEDVQTIEAIFAQTSDAALSADVLRTMRQDAVQQAMARATASGETTVASRAMAMADRAFAQSEESGISTVSSYAVTDGGDHVKISLGIRPEAAQSQAFGLRRSVGESYMPAQARGGNVVATPVSASVRVAPVVDTRILGNAAEFVPVSAGLMTATAASQPSNAAQVAEGREVLQSLIGRMGVLSHREAEDAEDSRFHLNVGGVDFDMSSQSFVQMVAKPVLGAASSSMPTLMDANNSLFAGYASLMHEIGNTRSLQEIRKAYVDAQARQGAQSVRSEIGFNTQSFAGILGASSAQSGAKSGSAHSSRRFADASYDATAETILLRQGNGNASGDAANAGYASGEQFSSDMAARTETVAFDSDVTPSSFSWVSNQASAESRDEHSHQILGKLDSLLDYVENKTERNVGVFSNDDTVRVVLEGLPKDGLLGNKGLPKWRQKDTRAARAAQARELREALAKIGASPVQGVQRFANKQYVSPNLMQEPQKDAGPLYSASDSNNSSSSSSSASSNAGNSSNAVSRSYSMTESDFAALADEIYQRIEESINEEFERRT